MNQEYIMNLISSKNELENRIKKITLGIAALQGIKYGNFEGYEFDRPCDYTNAIQEPNIEDYYKDNDGKLYHYENGSLYEDDIAAWKKTFIPTAIEATLYLGHENYEHISFPFEYLWTENWKELEMEKIEKEKREKEEENRKYLLEKENRERLEYKRLKNKFESKENENVQ